MLGNTTESISNAAITARSEFTNATSTSQNVVVGVGSFAGPSFTGVDGEAVTGTTTYTYDGSTMDKTDIERRLQRLLPTLLPPSAIPSPPMQLQRNSDGRNHVTMVDIAFDIDDGAITVKDDAVYGDTWAGIVTVDAPSSPPRLAMRKSKALTLSRTATSVPTPAQHL